MPIRDGGRGVAAVLIIIAILHDILVRFVFICFFSDTTPVTGLAQSPNGGAG